jgi:hypothetical protein
MNVDDRKVFHRGAVIAWGRSIGIPDETALSFMQKLGVTVIDDSETLRSLL